MLFPTLSFAIFFAVLWPVYRALPTRGRSGWLLAGSLLFYFLWLPPYLLLLLATLGVNYLLLRGMQASASPRPWLTASIVSTLTSLAAFKYLTFLAETFAPLMRWAGAGDLPVPELLLPLGISFYSFQIIALHVDVYRREIEAPASFARYALFICFFPQLIAGPILRGAEFLPQLKEGGRVSRERTRRGLWLIAGGLAKKVILSDLLLAPLVNLIYETPGVASAPVHLIATYAFAFQIYFDFSGYTDIARGIANLLGFHLPLNFEEPYLSRNPTEFWRRWHMTLSRWLRDYLYIPLGGNRQGPTRTAVNLFLTMLLGGLWHGAGWNFVIWGGLHGLLLAVHRPMRSRRPPDAPLRLADVGHILLCFHAVAALWIFFRAPTFDDAMTVITTIATGEWAVGWPWWPTLVVVLAAALHVAERVARQGFDRFLAWLDGPVGAVLEGAAFGIILALVVAANGAGGEFIYFQF